MEYNYYPPHTGVITQEYSAEHPAIDIACVPGDYIHAAHEGTLNYEWNGRMGNVATIRSGIHKTRYAHMEIIAPRGWYDRGDVIGTCGNTGSWSTGPHLHFESDQPYTFE